MLYQSHPESLVNQNEIPIGYEDAGQYGSFAISSEIMPYQSYPEKLVNQN